MTFDYGNSAELIGREEMLRAIKCRLGELGAKDGTLLSARSLHFEIRRSLLLDREYDRLARMWLAEIIATGRLPIWAVCPRTGDPTAMIPILGCAEAMIETPYLDSAHLREGARKCHGWLWACERERLDACLAGIRAVPSAEPVTAAPESIPEKAAGEPRNSPADRTKALAEKAKISLALAALIVRIAPGYRRWVAKEKGRFQQRQRHYAKIDQLVKGAGRQNGVTDRTARRYITLIDLVT
jgi:hypothetical protein